MNWFLIIVGAVLTAAGLVWTLQGFNVLPGSAMSGETLWATVGPLVAIAGVVMLVIGIRRRRRTSR